MPQLIHFGRQEKTFMPKGTARPATGGAARHGLAAAQSAQVG
jgi:hypothetical protein